MTLREIISRNPDLFYSQQWYSGESFMDREAELLLTMPEFRQWGFPYLFPQQKEMRASCASLAMLYVNNPEHELWGRFLWTDDLDSRGDRVYIGGKNRTGKIEIHRHLSITSNYGLPSWAA